MLIDVNREKDLWCSSTYSLAVINVDMSSTTINTDISECTKAPTLLR